MKLITREVLSEDVKETIKECMKKADTLPYFYFMHDPSREDCDEPSFRFPMAELRDQLVSSVFGHAYANAKGYDSEFLIEGTVAGAPVRINVTNEFKFDKNEPINKLTRRLTNFLSGDKVEEDTEVAEYQMHFDVLVILTPTRIGIIFVDEIGEEHLKKKRDVMLLSYWTKDVHWVAHDPFPEDFVAEPINFRNAINDLVRTSIHTIRNRAEGARHLVMSGSLRREYGKRARNRHR